MRKLAILAIVLGTLGATSGAAVGQLPPEKCQALKTKLAGKYFACREKAEAIAILKSTPPDFSKCSAKFTLKWGKYETAAANLCPDDVLTEEMDTFLSDYAATTADLIAGGSLPSCGDGDVNATGEHCDGVDLDGFTCATFGLVGTLGCDAYCDLDLSGCDFPGSCGDGSVNVAGEHCDGTDFDGYTCASFGMGGTLACDASCQFDTAGCGAAGSCGDGVVNVAGEHCDDADLDGYTCDSFDLPGTLACTESCDFDVSGCVPFCGDGVKNGDEECDGGDLGGDSCANHGDGIGQVSCDENCEIDSSACGDCAASGGAIVGGLCWFQSSGAGVDCNGVCGANNAAYDEATNTYAGSSGSNGNCGAVGAALRPGVPSVHATSCGDGWGCMYHSGLNYIVRCTDPATTASAYTLGNNTRFCACSAAP